MSCFYPRVGYQYWKRNKKGELVLAMKLGKCDGTVFRDDIHSSRGLSTPYLGAPSGTVDSYDDLTGQFIGPYLVPCGKCEACLLDRARSWAARVVMEMFYHSNCSYFVTLTYDDQKLPEHLWNSERQQMEYPGCSKTTNADGALSLRKDHLQLFFKRLRKRFPNSSIRYFAAGEYGSSSLRPHYHICLMGCPLTLIPFGMSGTGHPMYRSPELEAVWKCGFVSVSELCFSSASYTARYCQKKALGKDDSFYSALNIEPEFTVMSRKPALGTRYINDHADSIYSGDGMLILPASSKDKSSVVSIPRFFLDKVKNDPAYASDYLRIKDIQRTSGLNSVGSALAMSDFDEDSFFQVREQHFCEIYKNLRRNL